MARKLVSLGGGFAALLGLAALGCEPDEITRPTRAPVPEGAEVLEWNDDEPLLEAAAIEPIEAVPATATRRTFLPAAGPDPEFDGDEPVVARRIVYRVRIGVPNIVGSPIVDLALPAAELYVDVSDTRLRARFVGSGWPVDAGSEVRLRGDSPGAYLIDGRGGRPLAPGELATWFEGGVPRPGPRPYVRRDTYSRDAVARPGDLICALVAEWAGDERSSMAARCNHSAPVAFRVGFFRGERTADVPIELPRSALRADERGTLPEVIAATSRAFLEPSALGRLRANVRAGDEVYRRDEGEPVAEGLVVENLSDGRMVVVVDGIAIGWVDAGASGTFVGITPGLHEVGAMRPRGAVIMRARIIEVPGRTVLRARPVRESEAAEDPR